MTGVPVEIPQHIVRPLAEAMEDAAMRLIGRDLGTIHRDDIAAEALAAVWSEIQTHVREQVAGEIETEADRRNAARVEITGRPRDWDGPIGTGLRLAAAVARGAARDPGDTQ